MSQSSRLLLGLMFLTGVAGVFFWQDAQQLLLQPLTLTQQERFEVGLGKNFPAVLTALQSRGIFAAERLPRYLEVYARVTGRASALKAGEYELMPGMNSFDLLALVVSGKTVLHELRLIEGWTFAEARSAISASNELVHTLKDVDGDRVMTMLGRPELHPEGQFFPDTYRFPKGTTDVAFLRRAFSEMGRVLEQEWTLRQPDLPYHSPEEALIMASIIEKETGVPAERAQIAGVFVRRLLKGMKLQTDPTVIYGMGLDFDGKLRRRDLETDTPYNTYTRLGLPLSPICLPGRASLHAALHPAAGNSLFFVSRGDGTHQFSDTLDQHNSAVQRFQLRRHQ